MPDADAGDAVLVTDLFSFDLGARALVGTTAGELGRSEGWDWERVLGFFVVATLGLPVTADGGVALVAAAVMMDGWEHCLEVVAGQSSSKEEGVLCDDGRVVAPDLVG